MTTPPLVARALELAAARGFERSCSSETGALLHVLAARRGLERVAEIGTGCGVGAAWIVSALQPGIPFVTTEVDPDLAEAAHEVFATDPDVRVVAGDWREILAPEAPFDFLFLDAAKRQPERDGEAVVGLLAPGATVVLDDLTPGRDPAGDPLRSFWMRHPDLVATEVQVSESEAIIVAVRAAGLNPLANAS
jgi:predicted O-methyltransferase YrrM